METKQPSAGKARTYKEGASPQQTLCALLRDHGDMTREAIGVALTTLTSAQVSSALNNSKSKGRIVFIEKAQAWRLTKEGKDWVGDVAAPAGDEAPKRKRAAKKTAHRRGTKRAAPAREVDTSPADEEPSFRCGVLSDGAFHISKDDTSIELDAEEHAQMLRYLERMAEDPAA